jgi:CheY-like chemotaxis protein
MAHILVVEDEHYIRLLLTRVLRQLKHQVQEAKDGIEALERFKFAAVDLILTDLNMPRLNGVQLIEEICKDRNHPPIIVVSAYAEQITEACRKGATYHLHKPFTQPKLVQTVNEALSSVQ